MATKSETVFDEYCRLRGYRSECIQAGAAQGRTPDRLVTTPLGQVIVEIKELTANKDDLRKIRELRDQGWTSGGGTPGARAFELIKRVAPQLRAQAHRGLPCVAVFFDNIADGGLHPGGNPLEPSFIDFAMYGLQTVILAPDVSEFGTRLMHVGDGRGGRRQMTDDERVYISAVAVLRETGQPLRTFLHTYHNYFAVIPLWSGAFRGPGDQHFRKPTHPWESPQEWEEVTLD